MKKKKYNLLFAFIFLIFRSPLAESRATIDQMKLVEKGNIPQERENVKIDYSKIGFFSRPQGGFDNSSQNSIVGALLSSPDNYDNSIGLVLSCVEEKFPIKIPYKYRDIEWKLKNGKAFKVTGGKIQTDNEGKIGLHFISKGPIDGETLILYVEDRKVEIYVDKGPFEINLPTSFCKAKRTLF